MKPIKCLIVDDEEPARDLLVSYIEKLDFLELSGSYENALEALGEINKNQVELLFLDIQMPEIRGIEFAKTLTNDVKIIFTTAYSEYALEGFELNAVDYLLKPITFERFLKAVSKIKVKSAEETEDSITVKSGYDLHKLKYDDILYIESDSEYVVYHTPNAKIMSNQSLKKLEDLLPADLFFRVHRSFIVNKTKVTTLKGRDLLLGENSVPVSDTYYESIKNKFF